MRKHVISIVSVSAQGTAQRLVDAGADRRDVAVAVMEDARQNWIAPTEDEAFVGAIAAMYKLYPDDDRLRAEVRALSDRSKLGRSLLDGVPIDFERVDLAPMPDDALGLVALWQDSARPKRPTIEGGVSWRAHVFDE